MDFWDLQKQQTHPQFAHFFSSLAMAAADADEDLLEIPDLVYIDDPVLADMTQWLKLTPEWLMQRVCSVESDVTERSLFYTFDAWGLIRALKKDGSEPALAARLRTLVGNSQGEYTKGVASISLVCHNIRELTKQVEFLRAQLAGIDGGLSIQQISTEFNLAAELTLRQHMAQSLKLSAELATASLQLLTKVKEAVSIRGELDLIECKTWIQANITLITPPIYKFKSHFTQ